MKTQHSKHVDWMIVHWQLHAVVSTVKTIHEDNTADMLTGWLFSDNYTEFCQQSICLQWMHTQPINFVTTHTNKWVTTHMTKQFGRPTHTQPNNNETAHTPKWECITKQFGNGIHCQLLIWLQQTTKQFCNIIYIYQVINNNTRQSGKNTHNQTIG